MLVILQDLGSRKEFINAGDADGSFNQAWEERQVSNEFANIPRWMVVRLGKANTWRRKLLENYRSHRQITKNQQYFLDEGNSPASSIQIEMSGGEHSNQSARPKEPHLTENSYDGETVASYTETVADEGMLSFPPMPDQAKGGSLFECPFCFMTISGIHDRMEWK